MRKAIITAGLAAVLAATSFSGAAMADPYWHHDWHRHYWHHDHGGGGVGAFVAGTALGIIGGAIANDAYNRPYYGGPYYAGNSHVAWCEAHYRSYNPATDTFTAYSGRVERCISPYG